MIATADFETTTDKNDCRVWAFGLCNIETLDFMYGTDIESFMALCENMENSTLYFHNEKFDGTFIIDWLFRNGFTHILDKREKRTKTFSTLISDTGLFYSIEIYFKVESKTKKVLIYDSLKLLPFSVEQIAKDFDTKEQKGEIDYNKYRPVGYIPDEQEIYYLQKDVVIVAKALRMLFNLNLTKMTTGSNALAEYKNIITKKKFDKIFPVPLYDNEIRQSYKGGWTYLNKKYKGVNIDKGIVLDVNSLYPSVMYYKMLPYGEGIAYHGKYETDEFYPLYVQMIKCQFELKPNYLPTIQLKNNLHFCPTDYIESSENEEITLCLTSVDLQLFLEHYDVYNIEYISGWKFKGAVGHFKDYIEKWTKVKIEAGKTGNKAMRTIAKLMLNSLYGKFALSPVARSKIPYFDEQDNIVKFRIGAKEEREPIYIPVSTFITSYARETTIRAAQSVYDRFVYADTDSLHLVGETLPENLNIDNFELGKWKHESTFTRARFLRAKSYIEEIDGKLQATCAGMPDSCHEYVTWENFKIGNSFKGKLQHETVSGGVVLKPIDFTLKE